MIIKPMIRSNICINAHPIGCAKETERQIAYVKSQKDARGTKTYKEGGKGPKLALVLGCSTGYGLASRISAAFEYGADTIGVSFEKEPSERKGGTPGWYNNTAFDRAAAKDGLKSVTLNEDAFADETRAKVIEEIKKIGTKVDLIIYSLASPVRKDPADGVLYRSVIKPEDKPYTGKTMDMMTGKLIEATAEPASEKEVSDTIKVMGGADWILWINALLKAGVLSEGCRTVAYSYIGPELSHAIYRNGTIGAAKKDLEATALFLNETLKKAVNGAAYVSENKGLVTRSSAVIPIISLYLSVLFKVMKGKGTHEGCIEQMERLFAERLFTGTDSAPADVAVDSEHRIRIDDLEMDSSVQEEVDKRMALVTEETLPELADLTGYKHDFLAINGFDVDGVDYTKDVASMNVID